MREREGVYGIFIEGRVGVLLRFWMDKLKGEGTKEGVEWLSWFRRGRSTGEDAWLWWGGGTKEGVLLFCCCTVLGR